MQIEIYIDILFFINFIMISFILFITNKLLKNKTSIGKIFFTAFLSTLAYILTIIFIPYHKILNIIVITIIFISSVLICFRPKKVKEFFKIFLIINIVSFCIGGASIALFYYTNFGYFLNFTLDNFPVRFLVISIISTYIIIKLFLSWYKKIFFKKQSFYDITLYKDNSNVTLNALLDTGNNLKEPISKKPVIIAEFVAIKPILSEKLRLLFYEKQEDDLTKILDIWHEADLRFIPFKSVGKENGLLLGIKIDKLEICSNDKVIVEDVIVAISNFKLSNDSSYNALLNPELIDCLS